MDSAKIGVDGVVAPGGADAGNVAGLVRTDQLVGRGEKFPCAHVGDALNVVELAFQQLSSGQGGGLLEAFRWSGRFDGVAPAMFSI